MKKLSALLAYVLLLALVGCSADMTGVVDDDTTAASSDAGTKPDDPRVGAETCGNGLDDNGNGYIDDQCSCTAGQKQACWPGDRKNRGIGACKDGVQTCSAEDSEFPKWGPCVGAVLPSPDTSEDGIDQDCDGHGELLRCVPKTEVCTGGQDEDCDGKVDCADPDCASNAACAPKCVPSAEVCTGGKDEDCDGKVDCADPDCASNAACAPACVPWPHWEVCGDGKDNDCDGKTDCDDDECWDDNECSCTEFCTPGAQRWCDENAFCHWGKQTCGPDRRWGACGETNARPQGCGNEYFYDDECCVNAGQCCQAMPVFPEVWSVGTCQPVQVVCQHN